MGWAHIGAPLRRVVGAWGRGPRAEASGWALFVGGGFAGDEGAGEGRHGKGTGEGEAKCGPGTEAEQSALQGGEGGGANLAGGEEGGHAHAVRRAAGAVAGREGGG